MYEGVAYFHGAHGSQKRASNLQELELQRTLSHHVGAGNSAWVRSLHERPVLLTMELSLQPLKRSNNLKSTWVTKGKSSFDFFFLRTGIDSVCKGRTELFLSATSETSSLELNYGVLMQHKLGRCNAKSIKGEWIWKCYIVSDNIRNFTMAL